MPCQFAHKCKEMLREHMHSWTFARVTSIKKTATGFYYGFAQELTDPRVRREPRTVWFKGGKEVAVQQGWPGEAKIKELLLSHGAKVAPEKPKEE